MPKKVHLRPATIVMLIAGAFLVFLFSLDYLFFSACGRTVAIKELQELTGRETTISCFRITPPLNLVAQNLKIEGIFTADEVVISPSPLSLFTRSLALNQVKFINPELTIERNKLPAPVTPDRATEASGPEMPVSARPSAPSGSVSAPPPRPLRMILKRIEVEGGKVNFIDSVVSDTPLKITAQDIYVDISNLYLMPYSTIAKFAMQARLPWQSGIDEGRIDIRGWLNFFEKDVQATVIIQGIDGVAFYPYYAKWVNLGKARVDKAKLNFTSKIQGLHNDVIAQCHLELVDIARRPLEYDELNKKEAKIADALLDLFKLDSQGYAFDFTIPTRLDNPLFGFGFIQSAFDEKLLQGRRGRLNPFGLLMLPAKIVEGTIRGATDITKAMVIGTVGVGKVLKDTVTGSAENEPSEEN